MNNNGVFSLAYTKNQGGEGFVADLMQTGVMNLTSSDDNSYTAKIKSLTATLTLSGDNLTESTAGNSVVMTRQLITLSDKLSFDETATTLTFVGWSEDITLTEVTSLEDAAVGSYMVIKDSSGYSISYVIEEALANGLNWNGGAAGVWVSSGGESIWLTNAGDAAVFAGTNTAVFKDLAGVSESVVTLSGDVVSEGIVVNNSATAYKLTGSGALKDGAVAAYLTKSGAGTLTIENTGANTFTGGTEIEEGTLILGASAGLGTGDIVNNGVLELAQTGDVTISGAISGSGSVVKTGSGKVTLDSNGSYSGGTTVNAGTLLMTDAESLGTGAVTVNGGTLNMNGHAVANTVTITAGSLANADASTGVITVNATAGTAMAINTIDLGGATNIESITLGEFTRLSGANADMTGKTVSIKLDENCLTYGNIAGGFVIDGDLTLTAATTTLDLSNAAVHDILVANKYDSGGVFIGLSTGVLTIDNYKEVNFTPLLSELGYVVTAADNGTLKISGSTQLAYTVDTTANSDPNTITHYNALNPYAVVSVKNETLTIELNGAPSTDENAVQIRNLNGTDAEIFVNNSSTTEQAEVDLINSTDSSLQGNINANNVKLTKTGAYTLTVSGNLIGLGSTLAVEEGTIVIENTTELGELAVNGGAVTFGGATTLESISGSTGGTITANDTLLVTNQDSASLDNVVLTGEGSLKLDNVQMNLGAGSKLDGISVDINTGASLSANDATVTHNIKALNGVGTLTLNGSTVNVNGGGVFSGALAGTAKLNFSANQTLQGAGNAGYDVSATGCRLTLLGASANSVTSYNNLTITDGTLNIGSDTAANTQVNLAGSMTLTNTTVNITTDATRESDIAAPFVTATGDINLTDLTVNTVNLKGESGVSAADNDTLELSLFTSTGGAVSLNGAITLNDAVLASVYKDLKLGLNTAGNALVMTGVANRDNIFTVLASTPNSTTASELLWDARYEATAEGTLRNLYSAVIDNKTTNPAASANIMTAAVGSTVTALNMAQRDLLRDQMGLIRNRVAQMGVNQSYTNEDMPYFHMWMQATGSTASLDTDGDESGYDLDTWGGTFGMDVDVCTSLTMGLAFTASYGDLSARAADTAEGDMDSYFVNAFARYQNKQWSHLLVLTGGWHDASLSRTVNYGTGSYVGKGDTSGFGFGAMYEVAYDIALNENKTAILQPLFNASIMRTSVNGYAESGAGNAGLKVNDMDMTTSTLALGARLSGLVGSNIFGREALGEVRINVAQDLGDYQGKARVGFLGSPGSMGVVYGAEEGRTAIQLGAGLSVPVGYNGVIYVDGNIDMRSGSTSMNGSIGYRYDF